MRYGGRKARSCTSLSAASSEESAFEHAQNVQIQMHAQCIIRAFALHSYILSYPMILFADSEGYCQTARMRRLIWAYKVQRHDFIFLHDMAYIIKFIFSGPSCSKITMSLVNVSLKLRSLNMAYTLIFLLKQCDLQKLLTFFQQKYL